MARPKSTERAMAMYELYRHGHSAKDIAMAFGCSFQAVYKMFDRHGLARHSSNSAPLPFVVWGGKKYTIKKQSGYYRSTDRHHTFLHRDIWEAEHGPVPDGYEVHHEDENKQNNHPSNLVLIQKSKHSQHHMVSRRKRGFVSPSQWSPGEAPASPASQPRSNSPDAIRKRLARARAKASQ